jgi:hypothetical protein
MRRSELRFRGQFCVVSLLLSFFIAQKASGEEEIAAMPNRPGVASPADVTQKGVVEIEYGWQRGFRSHEIKTITVAAGLLRFGLAENFELRLGMENYVSQETAEHGRRSGIGDASPGFKYRLFKQDEVWPALSFSYEVKVPTASRRKGLGSGRVDHTLGFLASKELFSLDWNLSYFLSWVGKEGSKGFDDSHLWALSFSRSLFGPLALSGEIYGGPPVNRSTPGFGSTDWALTYALTPRAIFDVGVDIGLTSAARDITYFAGVTVALIDLYRFFGSKN